MGLGVNNSNAYDYIIKRNIKNYFFHPQFVDSIDFLAPFEALKL